AVKGYGAVTEIFSIKGPGGWSSQNISLPHAQALGIVANNYSLFAEDLSLGLIVPVESEGEVSLAPEVSPPATENTPYLRHDSTCQIEPATCFEPLVTGAPGFSDAPPGTSDFGHKAAVVGATADLPRRRCGRSACFPPAKAVCRSTVASTCSKPAGTRSRRMARASYGAPTASTCATWPRAKAKP